VTRWQREQAACAIVMGAAEVWTPERRAAHGRLTKRIAPEVCWCPRQDSNLRRTV